jgi:predicted nucleic acid-binding protein
VDRVFLDANVLYSAAYKPGSRLRRLWELPDTELWTSDYAIAEAMANLREDRPGQVAELERLLASPKLHRVAAAEADLPGGVAIHAGDRPILSAAIQARATHLLTGDRTHFGPYFGRSVAGILILPPSEYLSRR